MCCSALPLVTVKWLINNNKITSISSDAFAGTTALSSLYQMAPIFPRLFPPHIIFPHPLFSTNSQLQQHQLYSSGDIFRYNFAEISLCAAVQSSSWCLHSVRSHALLLYVSFLQQHLGNSVSRVRWPHTADVSSWNLLRSVWDALNVFSLSRKKHSRQQQDHISPLGCVLRFHRAGFSLSSDFPLSALLSASFFLLKISLLTRSFKFFRGRSLASLC